MSVLWVKRARFVKEKTVSDDIEKVSDALFISSVERFTKENKGNFLHGTFGFRVNNFFHRLTY